MYSVLCVMCYVLYHFYPSIILYSNGSIRDRNTENPNRVRACLPLHPETHGGTQPEVGGVPHVPSYRRSQETSRQRTCHHGEMVLHGSSDPAHEDRAFYQPTGFIEGTLNSGFPADQYRQEILMIHLRYLIAVQSACHMHFVDILLFFYIYHIIHHNCITRTTSKYTPAC